MNDGVSSVTDSLDKFSIIVVEVRREGDHASGERLAQETTEGSEEGEERRLVFRVLGVLRAVEGRSKGRQYDTRDDSRSTFGEGLVVGVDEAIQVIVNRTVNVGYLTSSSVRSGRDIAHANV